MTGGVVLPSKNKATHEYTLKELQDITKAGKADEYFSIGDVVGPIMLNGIVGDVTLTDYPAYFIIIGIDHLIEVEKPGYHTLTLQFGKSGLEDDAKFIALHGNFKPSTSIGGWAGSSLRTYCSQFKACLPTAWQEAIIPVTKYTDNVGQDPNYTGLLYEKVTATIEEVFLPNAGEGGDISAAYYNENLFEYVVSQEDIHYPDISINKLYNHDDFDKSSYSSWLRSPGTYTYYDAYWSSISNRVILSQVGNESSIQPCFCIGGVATDPPVVSTEKYMLKSEFDTRINQFGGKLIAVFSDSRYGWQVQYKFVDDSSNKYVIYNFAKQGYKLSEAEEFLNAAEIIYKYSTGELTETSGKIEPTLTANTTYVDYDNMENLIITYNGDGILTLKDTYSSSRYKSVSDSSYKTLYFEPVEGSPNSYRVHGIIETSNYATILTIHAYEGQQYASKTITINVDTTRDG